MRELGRLTLREDIFNQYLQFAEPAARVNDPAIRSRDEARRVDDDFGVELASSMLVRSHQ